MQVEIGNLKHVAAQEQKGFGANLRIMQGKCGLGGLNLYLDLSYLLV